MLIVSVEIMKKNRWKRNAKKQQKGARGTEAIGKGWDLNDFFVHLS